MIIPYVIISIGLVAFLLLLLLLLGDGAVVCLFSEGELGYDYCRDRDFDQTADRLPEMIGLYGRGRKIRANLILDFVLSFKQWVFKPNVLLHYIHIRKRSRVRC